MKDKVLISIILLLAITLIIETAYIIKLKIEKKPDLVTNNNAFNLRNRALNNFNNFSDINLLEKSIDSILNNNLNHFHSGNFISLSPDFHTFETDKDYVIRGYAPGLEKGKININISGDSIIISGEQKTNNEQKNGNFYKVESSFNSFTKTLPLPQNTKVGEAKTNYKDGYLVITIPKGNRFIGSNKLKQKEL